MTPKPWLFTRTLSGSGASTVKVLLNWGGKSAEALIDTSAGSTSKVHITGWSKTWKSAPMARVSCRTPGWPCCPSWLARPGCRQACRALASPRLLVHDRDRVTADLACAIADGADFRLPADQKELFGLVASVPTAWRMLNETAAGGPPALTQVTKAVNAAPRRSWAQIEARHGALPGAWIADKVLEGVTCIRLDATVSPAHSGKELADPVTKGLALTRCSGTAITPRSRWPGCCAAAARARIRLLIICRYLMTVSRRCRRSTGGG